jgi:sugar phosphate isomerase/epimerase
MHIGCAAYSYRSYLKNGEMDLFAFLDVAAELQLDGVELTSYFFATTADDYLLALKRQALCRGLVIAGAAVGNRFTSADAGERAEQVQHVKDWLAVAAKLGAPYLRIFAGATPKDHTEDEAFNWTVEAIRACVPTAATHGVMLALENHGGITATSDQVIRIHEAVDSEWQAVNLDTGNYRTDPYEHIQRTVPYAVTAHVKTEVPSEQGLVPADTQRILSTLGKAGYRGFINIEYEAREEARTAVPAFVAELRRTLAALR